MIPQFVADVLIPSILLYYGYLSFKAIESTNKDDDTQWLTFWLLYSIIAFAEIWTDILFSWIPFYSEGKIALILYLGLFKGAGNVYSVIVRPSVSRHESYIDKQVDYFRKQAEKYQKQAEKLAKEKVAEGAKYAKVSLMKAAADQNSQ